MDYGFKNVAACNIKLHLGDPLQNAEEIIEPLIIHQMEDGDYNKGSFLEIPKEAQEYVVDAMEKQTLHHVKRNENGVLYCPICERRARNEYDMYCSGCGRKLIYDLKGKRTEQSKPKTISDIIAEINERYDEMIEGNRKLSISDYHEFVTNELEKL